MRGLTEKLVREISARKNEPKWMLDLRLKALEIYDAMPLPKFGPALDELDLNEIENYVLPAHKMVHDWADVPVEIRETFDKLGIPEAEKAGLAGVGAQYDSELIYHNVKEQVEAKGVVYLPMEEAVNNPKWGEVVREKFMQLVPPDDHKFAALHAAVWSGGSFVYVPRNVNVEIPIQSYFRLNAPGAGQFEHTLIIVDEGADLHFIEGCSAPKYNVANLHAGCVELYVARNARLKYSTVESWSKNMYNLNTKRAIVAENGKIEWVTGSFGSHVSMLYPCAVLDGEGSQCEYTGVTFAGEGQKLDTGLKVIHKAARTSSFIDARSLAKDGGECAYRSLVKILPGATGAKSFADCKSLMCDNISRSDTLPTVEVMNPTAKVGHEASVGKIGDKEVHYLMSRGLSETEARALIVRGFTSDVSKELPLEYAMEMNNLIAMEMEGNT